MTSLMIRLAAILVTILPTICFATEGLQYDFSFGDHLDLRLDGQRISLTISNPTDQEITCKVFTLYDLYSSDNTTPRLLFHALEGEADCFGGSCPPFEPGPVWVVAEGFTGSYAAEESRTCEFEVQILREFSGTIRLVGDGGPIEVTRIVSVIPSLNITGLGILSVSVLLFGFIIIVRNGNEEHKNA